MPNFEPVSSVRALQKLTLFDTCAHVSTASFEAAGIAKFRKARLRNKLPGQPDRTTRFEWAESSQRSVKCYPGKKMNRAGAKAASLARRSFDRSRSNHRR